jgi:HD-GYP domain-containing protein (c-di-GMP phosphodiesterase class II)
MIKKNPDNSVPEEQFNQSDESIENIELDSQKNENKEDSLIADEESLTGKGSAKKSIDKGVDTEKENIAESEGGEGVAAADGIKAESTTISEVERAGEKSDNEDPSDSETNTKITEDISDDPEKDSLTNKIENTDPEESGVSTRTTEGGIAESSVESVVVVDPKDLEELPEVDYTKHSKGELVETIEILIENRPPAEIRDDVEKIKSLFYKTHKADNEKLRSQFIEEGGVLEDFKAPDDPLELKMRGLLAKYRGRKTELSKQIEVEKQENLKKKYEIIDRIKDLVNREESINKTFQEFKEIQNNWHSIGPVPQSSLKNLWETYNYNVEIFYDFIKINKELRDLDFKKNLEKKIALCDKADKLLTEPSPVNAFRKLQEYHQRWRETGPVPRESRNEIWERFKEVTAEVNRKHHEYFENLKEDQKKNLSLKSELCEKIESINGLKIESFKEWEDKARQVIELQKVWRTIGFAPKKQNNQIYQRFREACDQFFQAKRGFYSENKDLQMDNLQKKTDLCIAAEALQESTDWKATSDALIKLQKEWKEVGAVPRKHSDKVWKRFRKACDHFFTKKAEHFSELDSSFGENLKLKEAIIQKLEDFEPGADFKAAFEKIKAIQNSWVEIGFVPFKNKEEINQKYRNALNKQFDRLKIDDEQKEIFKYKSKLETLRDNPKTSRKIRTEREKFLIKIKQIEADLIIWENNIGFFSKSSSAEALIKDVEAKIENAKNSIQMLEEKIRMIDKSGLDD